MTTLKAVHSAKNLSEKPVYKRVHVFYNQYSVDAVITAAAIKRSNTRFEFKTFTSTFAEMAEKYIFIGCYPSEKQKATLRSISAEIEILHLSRMDTHDPDIEGIIYHSLLHHVFMKERILHASGQPSDIANVYSLMLALSEYNRHSQNMVTDGCKDFSSGLKNLALIWANWKKATRSLLSRENFEFVPADEEGFKDQIQMVKARLNSDMKVVPILMNRSKRFKQKRVSRLKSFLTDAKSSEEVIRVPFINTNVNDAPWYGRFLSRSFEYGILYEVIGSQIIVVPWSRDGEDVPDFTTTIKQHIGTDYTVVFANS